jgi:hypothetical protein
MAEALPHDPTDERGRSCAAGFVHRLGYWSHFDNHAGVSSWPLPQATTCAELGAWAASHSALVTKPEAGDVFLLPSHSGDWFAFAGIVLQVVGLPILGLDGLTCLTVEACTERSEREVDAGDGRGRRAVRRLRRFWPSMGHRFVRWAELDQRASAADATFVINVAAGRRWAA